MKIAVTGAVGRLGTAVCQVLIAAGHSLMATDLRFDRQLNTNIDVANLLDREGCYRLLQGADVLVHLGNHPHVWGRPPAQVYSENCAMNANIFQAAMELDIPKWIYTSSIQAMRGRRERDGTPSALAYIPADGQAPANPSNCYGLSKVAGEQMLQYYSAANGRTTIAIRFPMLLHLEQSPVGASRSSQPYPFPDELFTYLDFRDAASLVAAIIDADLTGYHCYLPAARQNLERKPAAELIKEFYPNVPLRKPIGEMRELVDLSPIQRDTGWTPKYE